MLKRNHKFVIVFVIIVVVLLLSTILIIPCLKFLKNRNQNNALFNKANIYTFVTEVQEYMIQAEDKFILDSSLLDFELGFVEYTSDNSDLNGNVKDKFYKINLDENGKFTSIIIYDETFCYNVSLVDNHLVSIDKTIVVPNDVYKHSKKDNLIDGCQGKKVNK